MPTSNVEFLLKLAGQLSLGERVEFYCRFRDAYYCRTLHPTSPAPLPLQPGQRVALARLWLRCPLPVSPSPPPPAPTP